MEQQEPSTRIPLRERFRRENRLRSPLDFQRARRAGRGAGGVYISLSYVRRDTASPVRIGFSVSKRVGNAIIRNRVKRRLREITRRLLARVAFGWDIVVTARPAAAQATYDTLEAELRALLTRARIWDAKDDANDTEESQGDA